LGQKVQRKKVERFFEGEVMWSKLYQSHKILSSLQLQKNDASPRTKLGSKNKTSRGRAKHKKCPDASHWRQDKDIELWLFVIRLKSFPSIF
jgi:hypothetical protein